MPDTQEVLSIFDTVSTDAAVLIGAIRGEPVQTVPVVREPAVSVGLTGQSGLILIGLAVIAIVYFATRK